MLKYGIVAVILTVVLACGSTCLAEENALTKLGRGLNNALTGWIEIPDHMYEVSKEHNVGMGMTYGAVKGAAYCTARTTAGAIEAGTFMLPEYDKPIMEPKYKF